MTPVVVTDLAIFSCGALALWLLRQLAAMLRPMRIRCSWCGKRMPPKFKGGVCAACLDALANDPREANGVNPRAAPIGWPEA